jgi:hypothetical protein
MNEASLDHLLEFVGWVRRDSSQRWHAVAFSGKKIPQLAELDFLPGKKFEPESESVILCVAKFLSILIT